MFRSVRHEGPGALTSLRPKRSGVTSIHQPRIALLVCDAVLIHLRHKQRTTGVRHTCKVTKAELADQLTPALELNKQEAEKVVDAVFAAVVNALATRQKLDIRGFGVFSVKDQPARQARNPRTGESVAVPAKRVAVFKPAKAIAEVLNPVTLVS